MSKMTVTRLFNLRKGRVGRQVGDVAPVERVPRVAKLMALAIRFDELIREDVVADQAELARVGHVTRARLTQIMNLLNLAPEIQEQLLDLRTPHGAAADISERQLRPIAAIPCWRKQRRAWLEECKSRSPRP